MITVKQAKRLEDSFLGGITEAQDAYEQIVAEEAWTVLGYDTFTDWWTDRVAPLMRQLSMYPNRKLAAKVIEQVAAEEAELPAAQRRTQAELGELVGVSKDTVGRTLGTRSLPDADAPRADLGHSDGRLCDVPGHGIGPHQACPETLPAADPLPVPIAEQIDQRIAERVTRPIPPRMTAEELAEHEEGVRRVQDIAAAHRQAATIVAEVQSMVVTVVTGSRYGETGLVSKDMIRQLREAIDLLEGEL